MRSWNLAIALVVGVGVAVILAFPGALSTLSPPVAARSVASISGVHKGAARPTLSNGLSPLYVSTTGVDSGDCSDSGLPCRTIQYAVDQAGAGSVVKVASGVYTDVHVRSRRDVTTTGIVTQVVYVSKTVTIRGGYTDAFIDPPDPEANPTTLDARGQGRGLYVTGFWAGSGQAVSSTVEGLHITGGDALDLGGHLDSEEDALDAGGGIYAIDAVLSLDSCGVSSNAASLGGGIYALSGTARLSHTVIFSNTGMGGGGVTLYASTAQLHGNSILSNTAIFGIGGGVYVQNSTATLNGNRIQGNLGDFRFGFCGGVYVYSSTVALTGNTIVGNEGLSGGGAYLGGSNATLKNNVVQDNTARGWGVSTGGGLRVLDSTVTLSGNTIQGNVADGAFGGSGGGVYLEGGNVTLDGNLILGNYAGGDGEFVADDGGGGVYLVSTVVTLTNNVVADNRADLAGGGLYVQGSSSRLLHNTIARNGAAGGTPGDILSTGVYVVEDLSGVPSTVVLTNTIIVSHGVGISVAGSGPHVVAVDGVLWYNTPNTVTRATTATVSVQTQHTGSPAFAADGYHLTAASAAIDAGLEAKVTTDIDGRPRLGDPDLGADEFGWTTFLPLAFRLDTPLPADIHGPGFADYSEITVTLPQSYEGYTLPVDLDTLGNIDRFAFSGAQSEFLAQSGFVVAPAEWLEFFQLYENASYNEMPVFVTTDSVYHVYHLLFDKMLRDLERERFEPDVRALTAACLRSARDLYDGLLGTELEDVARTVLAYFAVADGLIDPDAVAPPEVADLVAAELALIDAHVGLAPSPIFSRGCPGTCDPCAVAPPPECADQPCMCEDYSQYLPRGHYTRSEQLQRYFRTMMWYGHINMRLKVPDETRVALIITHVLRSTNVNGDQAADVWARVYDPTVFIVGKADDLGFHEYGALWDVVFGADAPVSDVADETKLAAFIEAARQLPPPQVNGMWVYIWEDVEQATQGFRFMGQRFVLDAYIFDELTFREVGTSLAPRMLPKGLDVMAALGSEQAYEILDQMGETAYLNYPEQMAKLRGEISALALDSWTQNLYWNWLYSLGPLLEEKGVEYPAFMQTQAWTRRDLHTALGSWTELKHDTILYAKQVMPPPSSIPPPDLCNGWVEPNPKAYARLLALTRMARAGLESRGLLTEDTDASLTHLDDLLVFLLDVAQRELAGELLTDEDYRRVKAYGSELEDLTLAATDVEQGEGEPIFDEDDQAAIVADVATSPEGQVLEEAIGRIFEIFVVVPDGAGGLHIARGGVFSYYEFPWPMSDRLTDETWRAMVATGQAPERPGWTALFVGE
jgi:hypothetical protein